MFDLCTGDSDMMQFRIHAARWESYSLEHLDFIGSKSSLSLSLHQVEMLRRPKGQIRRTNLQMLVDFIKQFAKELDYIAGLRHFDWLEAHTAS